MMNFQVLIVDDDQFFLEVYADFLTRHGFSVDTAASAEHALERCGVRNYQLLLVDLTLPDLSGFELIERIRELNPAQDVIVVTSTNDVRTAVRAMRMGVYDYLVKPVEQEELLLVIDRLQERITLYDEHRRLAHENATHLEMQKIFQKALGILQNLELESVCEKLLQVLAEVLGAQGTAIWLTKGAGNELAIQGFHGLVDTASLPMAWSPEHDREVGAEILRGLPVLTSRQITALTQTLPPAPGLLCPLVQNNQLLGVVHATDKLRGGFDALDITRAKVICDCAAMAVSHALRFHDLQRLGLRDAGTAAYNMTYFIDHLGREIHKARRYQRRFALLYIAIDNFDSLRKALRPEALQASLRAIVTSMTGALRDIDVLARVSESEMYLLLPETDLLGCLAVKHALSELLGRADLLRDPASQLPIHLSFGEAAFPRDGDDVDQLFAATRRRLEDSRKSVYRRLRLNELEFWEAVQLLLEHPSLSGFGRPKTREDGEFASGLQSMDFSPSLVEAIRHELLHEGQRLKEAEGWLYLGGPSVSRAPSQTFNVLERSALRAYSLMEQGSNVNHAVSPVTCVEINDQFLRDHEIILLFSEQLAYGLVGRWHDGVLRGFHTDDGVLVEGLILKLQENYHLQKRVA